MSSSTESAHGERRAFITAADHAVVPREALPEKQYLDSLTGLPNRHYLLEILEPQISVSQQYSFPVSLVLAEIAHFRQIRFTFGEKIAATVVKEISELIKNTVRATDLVVLYSEDTFAILLLHATRFGAGRACERIRHAVAQHSFAAGRSDLVVMVNYALAEQSAEWDPHGRNLMHEAEEALTRASHEGDGAIVRAE